MDYDITKTAHGIAKLATPEEIAREDGTYCLAADNGSVLATDSGVELIMNVPEFGYTNPDLHRRIDDDPVFDPDVDYPFSPRDEHGVPYKQSVVLGVWDGIHSYRTTTTYTHDEESTTCEIP